MSSEFNLRNKNDEYVDIHGHVISSEIHNTGEILFPLSELKQTGVGVYRKSQYKKLADTKIEFDEDFHMFMLESAQKYMLENKIAFSENDILNTINNCKKELSEKTKQAPDNILLRNRLIQEKGDNEILIQVRNLSLTEPTAHSSPLPSCKPTTPKVTHKISPNKQLLFKDSENLGAQLYNPTKQAVKKEVNGEHSQLRGGGNTSQLRLPRTNILEKIILNEEEKKEHNVVVTCIQKRNCAWVRDKANDGMFATIHKMANEEAKYQQIAHKPWQQEKVYLAQDEGSWFRCKVMRFNPLIVFFIDYGNVADNIAELKEVSDELAKIPCMAVRLTFRESDYDPNLEDEIKIKIIKKNEDGTYFVNVLQQVQKVKDMTLKCFKIPPNLATLENGQKVVVIHEERGILYLRTKECFHKLKEIELNIEEYIKSAQLLKSVEVKQLVLAPMADNKYYRAVVTKVNDTKIEIKYLDYHKTNTLHLYLLKSINEALSLEPVTYFKAQALKNYHSSDKNNKIMQTIIEKRKKFAVVLEDGDFDLYDGEYNLSELLSDSGNEQKKVYFQNMKNYEPEFGIKPYLCSYYKSSTDLTLVPSDQLTMHIESVLITDINDTKPYSPEINEVCYCFFQDEWYRCVITRILNNEYEVMLLDFGNVEVMAKDNLRKSNDSITSIPILALPCKLVDLPNHPNVEELLKTHLINGEIYNVEVIKITRGKYDVRIASVYEQIMNTH